MNALHPFREGNGRTQRAFFGQLAHEAGYRLGWEGVSRDAMVHASIAVMHGDARPMTALLRAHLVERGPERGSPRATPARGSASPAPSTPRGVVREPTASYGARAEPGQPEPRRPERGQPERGPAPRVRFVAVRLEQYERAIIAARAAADAREGHAGARAAVEDAQRAVRLETGADAALADALSRLYQEPGRARAAIDAAAATGGIAAAGRTLRTAPERFGALQAGDPGSVRASAALAADLSVRAATAHAAAPNAERLTALVEVEASARASVRTTAAALAATPAAEQLLQAAARGVVRLDAREFAQLARALPAYRAEMAVTLRDGVTRALAVDGVAAATPAGRSVVAVRAATQVHHAVLRLAPDELRAITGPGAAARATAGVQGMVRARVAVAVDAHALGRE